MKMLHVTIFVAVSVLGISEAGRVFLPANLRPLSREMVDAINNLNTTWKAGQNFPDDSLKHVKRVFGAKRSAEPGTTIVTHDLSSIEIPEEFDARKQWSHCESISLISDEGSCSSCWAHSTVEVISDRICVASEGKVQVNISAQDLVTCYPSCGSCSGGSLPCAWKTWIEAGLVTGGLYGSESGCLPYSIPPCEHYVNGTRPKCTQRPTPPCKRECQKGYPKKYQADKHYGKSWYRFFDKNIKQIQAEILKHGPVQSILNVFEDFLSYKSGVYQRHSDRFLTFHAVKILGWGVENKVPYWLVANSWNTDWGDKGYFKILRGHDECGIETEILAGLPKL